MNATPSAASAARRPERTGLDAPAGTALDAPALVAFATGPIVTLAVVTLALHLVVNAFTPYEFHRDEFLYFAMGRHLDFWRMDFPPGIALLAQSMRTLLGDSLFAIRLAPALAGTALVVLAAWLARDIGGGRWAQLLAALLVIGNPLFGRTASLFQPVVFDQLWWVLAFVALVRLARSPAPRWWILLGVAGGFGLLFKWSILFVGFGMLVAIVGTPLRRALRTPWPYVALGIALLIGHPSITGQLALDWPLRQQMAGLQDAQLGRIGFAEYAGTQLLFSPIGFVIAGVGLVSLIAASALRPFRAVGVTCATVWVLLYLLHGKPYYVGPIFPVLFAAGAVMVERVARPRLRATLLWTASATAVVWGIVTLPLAVPMLPPASMAAYAARLGVSAATTTNRGTQLKLPQDYADMLGWETKVREVARVYHSLSPDEQRDAVIFASNYGRAGAIDFYGPRYGLPPAVCACGTYWQFGPGQKPGRVIVAVGVKFVRLRPEFDSVAVVSTVREPWGVDEEQELNISVARGFHRTLQGIWPTIGPGYR